MENLKLYLRESYEELMERVSWPTWPNLLESAKVVLIATLIFVVFIFLMDLVSNSVLKFIYNIQ